MIARDRSTLLAALATLIAALPGALAATAQDIAAPASDAARPPHGATMPGVTVWAWDLDGRLPRRPSLIEGQVPNAYFIHPRIDLQEHIEGADGPMHDTFAGRVWGWLRVDGAGLHELRLHCDDGALLRLGDQVILDTERGEGFTIQGAVHLEQGLHPLEIWFYEDMGRFDLQLSWRPPGAEEFALVPTSHLLTEAGQTFVTAPRAKRFVLGEDERRPGDGRPLEDVHPSFTLEALRPPGFEPPVGGMTFLPDGRLAVCTWRPRGEVFLLDVSGDGPARVHRFAEGLGEPLGLEVLGGELLVTQKHEITRLRDTDGDGLCDRYETVASGWPASHNYHEFTFNLVHLDGAVYACTSVPLRGGLTNYTAGSLPAFAVAHGPGSVLRIDPDSGAWSRFATGLRAPNGLAIGPDGELFGCDNQGSWLPCSRVNHIRQGGFYGHQEEPDSDRSADPPVAWLPHGEIGNSPSQPVLVPDGMYRGQLLIGDVTHGGIKRLAVEKVGGVYQGAVFRFCQGLEAGVNRLLFGPDGALYVGGVGADGNWHHRNRRFGLERLRPGGPEPFEMLRVNARADGFTITFTRPAAANRIADPAAYEVTQYRYQPTIDYGGPKLDVRRRAVTSALRSPDSRQVFLKIPGLISGHVVHIHLRDFVDASGEPPWTTECWYTLNAFGEQAGGGFDDPRRAAGRDRSQRPPPGAIVLFDGRDASGLAMRNDGGPVAWPIADGCLLVDQHAGDLVSRARFEDCLLHVEWLSPPGGSLESQRNGNSGVKLQGRYEVQIMNSGGPPREARFNEAGSIYRVKAPDLNASTGPGTWQSYDIWFTAPRWDGAAKVADARMSVHWNGALVHDDVAVDRKTGLSDPEGPEPGPILLQAHPSDAVGPVRFRNVWVLPDPVLPDPVLAEPAARGVLRPRPGQ